MRQTIDINCDVGESCGTHIVGNDLELIPNITSANIACGAHGGSPEHTDAAVKLAAQHGVNIGAHPSYPDKENFGRKPMSMSQNDLRHCLSEQLAYLDHFAKKYEQSIRYVKPHGALYHACCHDRSIADLIAQTVCDFRSDLSILARSGSAIQLACTSLGMAFIREAFADRRYLNTGDLMPRSNSNAVIKSPQEVAQQAVNIALQQSAISNAGKSIPIHADSICLHGDTSGAAENLEAILQSFQNEEIGIRSF